MAGKTLSARITDATLPRISAIFKREVVQECCALSLLLAVAFCVLAIISYDPADVAGNVYPVNESVRNLGGRVGAILVETGYRFLGVGTFLLVALLGIYATLVFFRRKAADWPLRMLGTVLLVFTFSSLFGGSYSESGLMPSRGGVVGASIFALLDANFGLTGTYLVLGFVALLSFLLATDVLFYPIIRDLLHPLGNDNDLSGPLDIEFSPEPLLDEPEEKRGNWLTRLFLRGAEEEQATEAVEAAAVAAVAAEPADETEKEAAPAEAAPKKRVNRRPAVKEEAEGEGEEKSFEEQIAAYTPPTVDLLQVHKKPDAQNNRDEQKVCMELIRQTFAHFKLDVKIVGVTRGPTVTTYELEIPPDVLVSKLDRYKNNLAVNLRVPMVRIDMATGRGTIALEVPNRVRDMVGFREILESPEFEKARKSMELPMAFGKDSIGQVVVRDLASMPHLIVGGATGQGKSVLENVMLGSLLFARTPKDVRLVLVDPKQVEFMPYAHTPHLIAPVIDESRRAVGVFEWVVAEMERRYTLLKYAGVKKITEYNELKKNTRREKLTAAGLDPNDANENLPYIVVMVDELADLMIVCADSKLDEMINRIAAKARAAGIHLILVTQSPRSDVLSGMIKANIPSRCSLKVGTGTDSRVVLDQIGAEDLLGKGDLLMVQPGDAKAVRVQSAFMQEKELDALLGHMRSQIKPQYVIDPAKLRMAESEDAPAAADGDAPLDEKFAAAVDQVMATGRGSAQFLRSALRIGYNAATTLVYQMERAGILGPARGSKEREILITMEEWEARKAAGNYSGAPAGAGAVDSEIES
ncbi:DNA translocase SftA [Planctomycetaceae bacterium]|nr:DNA translocase SftA [Planctomycetaceae bacterium]